MTVCVKGENKKNKKQKTVCNNSINVPSSCLSPRYIHCLLVQTFVMMSMSVQIRASCPSSLLDDAHMQSMELSGISARGGIFAGIQEGGSMPLTLGEGSTFSQSSILSPKPSQLIWKRVTRGLEAKMFLWSWKTEASNGGGYLLTFSP